jgi:putative ABC transport system substrate-binding protein
MAFRPRQKSVVWRIALAVSCKARFDSEEEEHLKPTLIFGLKHYPAARSRTGPSCDAASGGFVVASAAKAITNTILIVFIVAEDPVKLGLVASRPGGNLTGVNFLATELVAKRLELLRELLPGATRIAVLINPADAANTEPTLRDVDAAARAIGLQIQVVRASTSHEIESAFATIAHERPDALLVGNAPFLNIRRVQLVQTGGASRDPSGIQGVNTPKSAA